MTQAQATEVQAQRWRAIAINETWRLAPWADVLYGCDYLWWANRAPDEFAGLRVVGHLPKRGAATVLPPDLAKWQDVLRYAPTKGGCREMIFDGPETGAGQSSAFQAANLAVRWGASRVVLYGVDCHSPNAHWHGRHTFPGAGEQRDNLMAIWRESWANAARQLAERGVELVNASPGSAVGVG